MYAKIFCFALLVAVASARMTRSIEGGSSFEEIRSNLTAAGNHINDMIKNLADEEKVKKLISDSSKLLADKTTQVITKLQNDLKTVQEKSTEDVIKSTIQSLQETATKLNDQIASDHTLENLKKGLAEAITTVVNDGQKLADAAKSDDVAKHLSDWAEGSVKKVVEGVAVLEKKIHEVSGHGEHAGH